MATCFFRVPCKIVNVEFKLDKLRSDLEQELGNILDYWMKHAIDNESGGFYGRINNHNIVDTEAAKGLVLNARILWTFSAAYNFTGNQKYLPVASRAFQYLAEHFADDQYGGFYWAVDKTGKPLETRKQVYGIAFCCYGFSEYYRASNDLASLQQAKNCFKLIEAYSFDKEKTGYFEAFTREWEPIPDLRLSARDANEKKTMNTHLHVLEAYTNLYRVWNDEALRKSIFQLLENFKDHIFSKDTGHLHLFFDEDWNVKSKIISFGHDIEAAWLLPEAAGLMDEEDVLNHFRRLSLKLTNAANEGIDRDGGLWYELEHGKLLKQKHSWPQAEAMVGYFNAWQLTGSDLYLNQVISSWQFIRQNILDRENGEWFWGVDEDGLILKNQDKAGFWKGPYHSSRACMEIIKRVKHLRP